MKYKNYMDVCSWIIYVFQNQIADNMELTDFITN